MMRWICILIIAASCSNLVSGQGNYSHATRTSLANHLLTGYDVKARPEAYVNISATLILTHMNSLDTINQVMDMSGGFEMYWTDSRLAWDTSVYNIDSILVFKSEIWVPPVAVWNAADGRTIFSDDDDTASEPLRVTSTGGVTWGHSVRMVTQCAVNIQYFPFDHQQCHILILPWGYTSDEMQIVPGSDAINTEQYSENGEWAMSKTTAVAFPSSVSGTTYGILRLTLDFDRKQSYYILNILLPVVFLAFLGPIVFVLPVESGEKAGFSLTILLSLSVVMTIVADLIPSTSTHVSSLSVYLLITYIMCVIEVLVTAFTIRIHHFDAMGRKVPARVNRLIQKFLAPLVCFRRLNKNGEKEGPEKVKTNKVDISRVSVHELKDSSINLKRGNPSWNDNNEEEGGKEDDELIEYSHEEFCLMLDSINLYFFEAVTILITVISFMTISMGGSHS